LEKLWRISADLVSQTLYITYGDGSIKAVPLYGLDAFRFLSRLWIKAGWACKYTYNFSWMGRPVIQLPEDIVMIQEIICKVRPDIIVETGVAHGGSAVFFASLFEAFGHGRVISIDIEIRPHNRKAVEEHFLKERITLIEGSSIALDTVQQVRRLIKPEERVMVFLDSNHSKDHVRRELELYSPLVARGSYVVVADGNMADLCDVPGGRSEWINDNPRAAIQEFLTSHSEFEVDHEPGRLGVTYWPDGYLKRK
jgi:cephalosporin hydroxylase